MPSVRYRCAGVTVENGSLGATLLEVSIAHKITHWHECGGNGRCTTCRVRVLDGASHLSAPTRREAELAKARGWDPTIRLACQTSASGDVTLERIVLSEATASQLRAETVGREAGTERQLAILFCDMRDFTALADSNSAFDVVHILNRFFEALGDPILLNGGVISHYAGDQICGLFGLDDANPARICSGAMRAAFGMVEAMEGLNEELARAFGIRIRIGIGLHFGNAIVGYVGHSTLRRLTIIGDDVNTASRIESMTKELGATILVSRAVAERLADGSLSVIATKMARLRGKREDIELLAVDRFADRSPFALAQRSVGLLLDDPSAFAAQFYANLFAIRPELEQLFVNGTRAQGAMLSHMLRSVVSGLERRKHVTIGLQTMGRKHVGYGVELDHYGTFKAAMLKTISDIMGVGLTPEIEASWSATLDVVLGLMKEGAGAEFRRN
ncbi:adenylate/guanylate cyclase domain-containing protein [Rhizobium sp. BK251]|uniref:adenylate/guanylate cyclase domain-containing protein n=1 Tax=Rhizobium sp. BK251 TaxID=2512125 RepID=UPI00104EA521|nr:adenylate/guanylate cyclase domain-containing protein [Rhizobium sp. BK251]TCL62226.1 class 3 adenylate cyclase [Rhizobium sp. BK251]